MTQLQESALRRGMSSRRKDSAVHRAAQIGRHSRCSRRHRRRLVAAEHLRSRMPAGDAVRGVVHTRHQGRTCRNRQTRTFRRRLATRQRSCVGGSDREERSPRSRRRKRTVVARMCKRPRQVGLRRNGIRGSARTWRSTRIRHTRIPSAQTNDCSRRNRCGTETGRQVRDRRNRRTHRNRRFADE